MAIIIVLAGLVIATSGYVQEKSNRSRTEAEIAAMSAALESYKADNGIYPTGADTENVNPATSPVPANASRFLYGELTGDRDFDGVTNPDAKSYIPFKPANLQRVNMSQPVSDANRVTAIRDPFGDPYGYSTAKATQPTNTVGFNPTFDLWSRAGDESGSQAKWIKNW